MSNSIDLSIERVLLNDYMPSSGKMLRPAYAKDYPKDMVYFMHLTGGNAYLKDTEKNVCLLESNAKLHNITITWINR